MAAKKGKIKAGAVEPDEFSEDQEVVKDDGLVDIDLGGREIQLGNEYYRGKMRVSPPVADQLMSMMNRVRADGMLVKDLFSKK